MARTVSVVPHTHWDREWYWPVPERSGCGWSTCSTTCSPSLEADPSLRPLPARRPDGRGRRLPRGPARGRGAGCAALAALRAPRHGPLVRPARTSSWSRARPSCATSSSACAGPPASAGRWRSATCPTCSATSPRCPRSCASSASTTPSCGGACPSAVDRSGFWWDGARRLDGAGRVPAPRATATAPACPTTPRRSLRPGRRVRGRPTATCSTGPMLWMNGTDHLMPQPWLGRVVAEANDAAGRLRAGHRSLAEHVAAAPDRGPAHAGRASCAPGPGPTC